MNRILLRLFLAVSVLSVLVVLPQKTGAQAVFRVNQYNVLYDGSIMPVFTLSGNYPLSSALSFTSYFYINGAKGSSWGEGLAGPTWTPARGVALSFLAGIQTNEESLFRVSPVFNLAKGRFSSFGGFEYGGKRHRWDTMLFYHAGQFKLGGEFIRYYQMFAAGPRFEFTFLKKQPLTVYYSGLWDWQGEKYASMFGIYSSFGNLLHHRDE